WGRARIGTYSKGMVQRLGLAQALMHDPQLVLLDEPTDGLDPMGRRGVRELLTRLRDEGKTVFLNSHLLSEAEMVCDRVAILNDGKVVRQGRLAELTRKSLLYEIELEGADPAGALDAVRGALPAGADRKVALNGGVLRVEGVDAAGIQPAIDALRARKIVIRSLRAERQSLEDLFIETVTALPPAPPAAQKGGAR
ncbi:MAG TPA: ABC transporter ATP-binding protein, partial [Phycisphaerae bacterium]|nr:ABC transporter ATP-binding protein [Phycisphaerae bacterium]